MATFGVIGTGNMGGAVAKALCKTISPSNVFLANRTAAKAEDLAAELSCQATSNETIADQADFIILAVKPQLMEGILSSLSRFFKHRRTHFVLVSMAAGVTIDRIQQYAGGIYPIIRIMPNTPVAIGEGVLLYDTSGVSDAEREEFCHSLSAAGSLTPLAEPLMDAGTAVSGCGPAFVDLFIEALADGGVAAGLPRAIAMELAAQTVAGSAKLVTETGRHPGVLKDAVCSPGGTTIAGVRTLEQRGFRAATMDAVLAAFEKTKQLG